MGSPASLTERATERLPLRQSRNGSGPDGASDLTPILVLAIAFLAGLVAARMLDWRTHAHPND